MYTFESLIQETHPGKSGKECIHLNH